MHCKISNRKFTKDEKKELKSKKYRAWKHTLSEVKEGSTTDTAIFLLSGRYSGHHTAKITPVVVKRKNMFKVVLSLPKSFVSEYSQIGFPTVSFIAGPTIGNVIRIAEGFAKAQINMLLSKPGKVIKEPARRKPKPSKAPNLDLASRLLTRKF